MKRLLFTLALVFALCGIASATDITIASSVLPGATFQNAGVSRSVTVTATNSSTTVTSSAAFPVSLVGLSGWKIAINGSDYTVSACASTSSLTLATSFTGSTSSYTATIYPMLLLRVYSSQAFTPFGASYVIQSGSPSTPNGFFTQVGCSIVGGSLYVPTVTLPSMLDSANAQDRNARYSAFFFTLSGALVKPYNGFESFQVPASPTSTTWPLLATYNAPASTYQLDSTTYSRDQINNLIAILQVSSLPSTCTVGSSLPVGYSGNLYLCTATNTWTKYLSYDSTLTTTNNVPYLSAAGTFSGESNLTWDHSISKLFATNFVTNRLNINNASNTVGYVRLSQGDASHYGFLSWHSPNDTRAGLFGYGGYTGVAANDYLDLTLDNVNHIRFTGGLRFLSLTASTVPYLDSNKAITSSAVTPTELGYVSGVTSAIQTQLGAKASTALDNLSGTAIAVDLNPATPGSPSLGSPGNPWHYLYVSGQSGTPGTNYFKITGTSTGGLRTKTLGDASDTLIGTLTGSAAPAVTPNYIGQVFVDTNNKKIYFATGTSSSADWTIVN